LAFPSNQFGGQAPRSSSCERGYMYKKIGMPHGSFPIFDKVDVNGPESLPLYRFLRARAPKLPGCAGCNVAWNYEKFLVDAAGVPVARYAAATSPLEAEPTIVKLLGAQPNAGVSV